MNRRPKNLGPRVTVSVTSEDFDTLNMLANRDDVSVSWVVRRAMDEYLRRHRQPARAAQGLATEKQTTPSSLT
jgi:predicted transcriptional regulator